MKKFGAFVIIAVLAFLNACTATSPKLGMTTVWGSISYVCETSEFEITLRDFDEEAKQSANLLGYYFDKKSDETSEVVGTFSTKIVTKKDESRPKRFYVENSLRLSGRYLTKDGKQIGDDFDDQIDSTCVFYVDNENNIVLVESTKNYKVHSILKENKDFSLTSFDFSVSSNYTSKKCEIVLTNNPSCEKEYTFENNLQKKTANLSNAKNLYDDEMVAQIIRSFSTDKNFINSNASVTNFQMIDKTSGSLQSFSCDTKNIKLAKLQFAQKVVSLNDEYESLQDLISQPFDKENVDCYVVSLSNTKYSTSAPLKYYYIKDDVLGLQNELYKQGKEHNFARLVQIEQNRLIYKLKNYKNEGIGFALLESWYSLEVYKWRRYNKTP